MPGLVGRIMPIAGSIDRELVEGLILKNKGRRAQVDIELVGWQKQTIHHERTFSLRDASSLGMGGGLRHTESLRWREEWEETKHRRRPKLTSGGEGVMRGPYTKSWKKWWWKP